MLFIAATLLLGAIEPDTFCTSVADNHGCCPACGYTWDGAKCVTQMPAITPYCKQLKEEAHSGCCEFCKYTWSGEKCEKKTTDLVEEKVDPPKPKNGDGYSSMSDKATTSSLGHTDVETFCERVADNHGCCPACAYSWDGSKCVTQMPAITPYCKQLKEEKHSGCCEACTYGWNGEKCEMKTA